MQVRTILSQNTTDATSHRAFAALKEALPTWEAVRLAEPGAASLRSCSSCVHRRRLLSPTHTRLAVMHASPLSSPTRCRRGGGRDTRRRAGRSQGRQAP